MGSTNKWLMVWAALLMGGLLSGQAAAQDMGAQGDALTAQTGMDIEPLPAAERFVPRAINAESFAGGALTLRPDATVIDSHIRVKNVCRWSESDAAFFGPAADLTVAVIPGASQYARVTLDQVRQTLSGAGMNVAMVRFGGATNCAVNRAAAADDGQSLEDWAQSRQATTAAASVPAGGTPAAVTQVVADGKSLLSLRQILITDYCGRLQLDPADLEMVFNSADDSVLNLVEPYFQFQIKPKLVRTLGDVSWDVVIVAAGQRHKASITATAKLWRTEVVLQKPISYKQVIRDGDISEKRVLLEELSDERLLTRDQVVGQEASRELKPGTVLSSSMVDPLLLARAGQLVTVTVVQGTVRITAVAKAIEGGAYGQTIRARSDMDPTQVFEVTLTGPQQGTVTGVPTDNRNTSPIAAAAN